MRLNSLALVLSFFVGMIFVVVHTPKPALVVKFPSPGVPSELYHTAGGSCYKVHSEEVSCPKDRRNVVPQPVTDGDVSDPLMKYFA